MNPYWVFGFISLIFLSLIIYIIIRLNELEEMQTAEEKVVMEEVGIEKQDIVIHKTVVQPQPSPSTIIKTEKGEKGEKGEAGNDFHIDLVTSLTDESMKIVQSDIKNEVLLQSHYVYLVTIDNRQTTSVPIYALPDEKDVTQTCMSGHLLIYADQKWYDFGILGGSSKIESKQINDETCANGEIQRDLYLSSNIVLPNSETNGSNGPRTANFDYFHIHDQNDIQSSHLNYPRLFHLPEIQPPYLIFHYRVYLNYNSL